MEKKKCKQDTDHLFKSRWELDANKGNRGIWNEERSVKIEAEQSFFLIFVWFPWEVRVVRDFFWASPQKNPRLSCADFSPSWLGFITYSIYF